MDVDALPPDLRREFAQELPGEQAAFCVLVCPEDGRSLDLRKYVRSLMDHVQNDLGRALRWAVVHHSDPGSTVHPHAHVLIRGIDLSGAAVALPEEYIASGLRKRAVEVANDARVAWTH